MMTIAGTEGRVLLLVLALFAFGGCERCEGPRRDVAALPDLGYPTCDGAALPEGEVIASNVLRAGPSMRDQEVVERFEIRRRGCVTVVRASQEWPLGTSDLDVVFDAELAPLRVWKRTTMPDASGPIGHRDVRLVELRTDPVGLTRRTPTGEWERFELRGAKPRAVIGPGRGLMTMWFRRARLSEGGRVREPVLDVREPIAQIREVTLQRLEDRDVEGLGRVRVYTIFGREPILTDEHDVVVGDLFGMRAASTMEGAIPDPLPDPGPIDPTAFQ
jgi:hypothetical protein